MLALSKAEALSRGEKVYIAATPCSRGHVPTIRRVTGDCIACAKIRSTAELARLKTDPERKKRRYARVAENRAELRARDPEGYRARRRIEARKCKTGMTEEQYQYFLLAQDNHCALCDSAFSTSKKAYADHCHNTGQVRGLLCRECNLAEGMINALGVDPQVWAERLSKYLAK